MQEKVMVIMDCYKEVIKGLSPFSKTLIDLQDYFAY